jgi:hypothetical protein
MCNKQWKSGIPRKAKEAWNKETQVLNITSSKMLNIGPGTDLHKFPISVGGTCNNYELENVISLKWK